MNKRLINARMMAQNSLRVLDSTKKVLKDEFTKFSQMNMKAGPQIPPAFCISDGRRQKTWQQFWWHAW